MKEMYEIFSADFSVIVLVQKTKQLEKHVFIIDVNRLNEHCILGQKRQLSILGKSVVKLKQLASYVFP